MGNSCTRSTTRRSIKDEYSIGHTLGVGSFGHVKLVTKRSSGMKYACKIVKKKNQGAGKAPLVTMFRNEAAILSKLGTLSSGVLWVGPLDHPNIIKMHEVFEDSQNFGTEVPVRIGCSTTVDIKAENFLFRKQALELDKSSLVLIDFGMSVEFSPDEEQCLSHVCGSPHYVAPELIVKKYRNEVDLWALGIVVYLMLYGKYPFEGGSQKEIAQKVLKVEPNFYTRRADRISLAAIDFVKRLLRKNPKNRMTASQALQHPWILDLTPVTGHCTPSLHALSTLDAYCLVDPRRAASSSGRKRIKEDDNGTAESEYLSMYNRTPNSQPLGVMLTEDTSMFASSRESSENSNGTYRSRSYSVTKIIASPRRGRRVR